MVLNRKSQLLGDRADRAITETKAAMSGATKHTV